MSDRSTLIRAVPYFAELSPPELVAVEQNLIERRLTADQIGFLEGDRAAGLFLIVAGRAKIYRISADGREQVLALLRPGDSCNEVPVIDGGPNPATLAAVEDTRVWIWTRQVMDQLRREIPALNEAIIRSLGARCRELVDKVYTLSFLSVTSRLADMMLAHADQKGELDRKQWTQDEIAAHIGTVREMVSRALRNLEQDGLIRFDRLCIQILDRTGLERLL